MCLNGQTKNYERSDMMTPNLCIACSTSIFIRSALYMTNDNHKYERPMQMTLCTRFCSTFKSGRPYMATDDVTHLNGLRAIVVRNYSSLAQHLRKYKYNDPAQVALNSWYLV